MTPREQLLDLVDRRRTDRAIFAPLADSLFAASVAGTPWVSDVGLDEQIAAADACGYHACFVTGSAPDLGVNPALDVETRRTLANDQERHFLQVIRTPAGELTRTLVDRPTEGITVVEDWLDSADQLDIADAISEDLLAGHQDDRIRQTYGAFAEKAAGCGVSQVQLELPFFLYSLPGFADKPLLLHLTEADRYGRSMDLAERALHHVAGLLIDAGVDFIWIGAPGTELLNPPIWENVIIPQSKRLADHVRACGGRTHFHCCGQSAQWIESGYFNRIGMDVAETLSPPPAGNVMDLPAARRQIDRGIVTRGNIDLELIRTGDPVQCAEAARNVMQAVAGTPHILGAADALLYGTPVANVRAIQDYAAELDGRLHQEDA